MTNGQIDELLAEIGRAPLLTIDEERALLKAVKEKGTNCDEMKRLEQANMRFVVSLIVQYQNRGLTVDELIEAGKAGLRETAENYVIESDNKFITNAVKYMRHHMEQAIAEKNQDEK